MGQTCDPTVQDCTLGPTYGAISTPSLNSLLTPGISTPSDILTPNISTLNASTLPTSLSSWLQQNQTMILIGGGLLFGVALLKGLGQAMKLEFANTPTEVLPVLKQQLESFGAKVVFETPFSGRVDSIAGKLHFVHAGQTLTISLGEDQGHFTPALLVGRDQANGG